MSSGNGQSDQVRVFVSYSRTDTAFADRLSGALSGLGFLVLLDRTAISGGEEWMPRIEQLIRNSDVVVFAVSPESVASDICTWETERTLQLGKRLLPVICRPVAPASLPPPISQRNFISLENTQRFDENIAAVVEACRVDIGWVREHTRVTALAAEWIHSGRAEGKLLRADEVASTRAWARMRTSSCPEIPNELTEYLDASEARENADWTKLRTITARAFVRPAQLALREGQYTAAMRIAAAGVYLSDDRDGRLCTELATAFFTATFLTSVRRIIRAPGGWMGPAALSADRARAVIPCGDQTARVWNLATGEELCCLTGHTGKVLEAHFDREARKIVTLSEDASVRQWDAETGVQLGVLEGVGDPIFTGIGIPPDCEHVFVLKDKSRVYDFTGGWRELDLARNLAAPAFDTEGRFVALASRSDVRVLDGTTLKVKANLRVPQAGARIEEVAFSNDGVALAVASNKRIDIFDVRSSRLARTLHTDCSNRVLRFVSDTLLLCAGDGVGETWNPKTAKRMARLQGHTHEILDMRASADGGRVVTASKDKTVRVWSAATGEMIARLAEHTGFVRSASFLSDTTLFTTSQDGAGILWDAAEANEFQDAALKDKMRFDASEGWSITKEKAGRTFQLRGPTSAFFTRIKERSERAEATLSVEAKRVVTAIKGETTRLWDFDGRLVTELSRHGGDVYVRRFTPDGKRLVTAGLDGAAEVIDAATGRMIWRLPHGDYVMGATVSPDSTLLATQYWHSAHEGNACLWSLISGEKLGEFSNQGKDACPELQFSWDSAYASVYGAGDGAVRILDTRSADWIMEFRKPGDGSWTDTVWSPNAPLLLLVGDFTQPYLARLGTRDGAWLGDGVPARPMGSGACFSPNGSKIAFCDDRQTCHIWETEGPREIVAFFHPLGSTHFYDERTFHGYDTFWDVSRVEALGGDIRSTLVAALSHGVGLKTITETNDLLMQSAPDDLFAALGQWLNPVLDEDVLSKQLVLNAPRHLNCYSRRLREPQTRDA